MSDNSILSILHISDFHYTKRKEREQKIVVDALIADLKNLCIGHRKPDLVIFTGDLVQSADTDSHDEAYDFLLSRVTKATGCSDERLFVVPGNHDLSRAAVTDTTSEHQTWRQNAGNMAEINRLYEAGSFAEIAAKKFKAYTDLEQYLSGAAIRHHNPFATLFRIEALNADLVVVNTAMFSTGGLEAFGADQGSLVVPEYALLEVAAQLTKGSYRIYATHHPFEMLSEAGSRMLRRSIEENANIHLFGHMHDPEARNTVSFKGELFSDQAGAVFTRRQKAYIGYSLISVEITSNNIETHLRTYFDDRKAFDAAIDVVSEGRFYSSEASRQFWRTIAKPVDETKFRSHLSGPILAAMNNELSASEGDLEAHEKFVPPPMKRTDLRTTTAGKKNNIVETAICFDDLVRNDANIILYAAAEYGRTTVLKELNHRLLFEAETLRFPRVPLMIDFADIKQNTENLLRVVRGRSPE